jgi:hypothetical protein
MAWLTGYPGKRNDFVYYVELIPASSLDCSVYFFRKVKKW